MMKRYPLIFAFVMALFVSLNAQVVINEFSAANKTDYADVSGNYYDWIELYNPTASAVNIGGWFLADNPGNLVKWPIPAGVTIPSHGFKVFFCSNLDGLFNGQYHTNFKLTQSDTSEVIILSNASVTIVDSITLFPNRVDQSRGRNADGSLVWGVYQNSTPNATNNVQTAYTDYVPKVQFSLPAGFYTGTQSVSLSCPMANTKIRYTTNGSNPTTASTLYTGPISVSANTVIRARAYDNAGLYVGSFTENNTYFINETHTLPVLSLASDQFNNLFQSNVNSIVGSMEYFGTNGSQIFEIESEYSPHGNDSWAYPQKGMDFNVEDEYGTGKDINYKMFSTTPRHHYNWLILKAAASDNFPGNLPNPAAHIRDAYVQTLAEKFKLNVDLRRMEHCLLFINGQYWGVYEIRDKVDKDYFDYYYNQSEKYVDNLNYWGSMIIRQGSDTAWNNLYNFVISNNLAIPANYTFVTDRLNVMSMIDAIAIGLYTVDSDWLNWNTAWWRGRKQPNIQKWKYWLWDEDNTFDLGEDFTGWGNTGNTANPCDINTASGGGPDFSNLNIGPAMGHIVIFNALMQNPAFKQLYINRFADLINTAFSCTNMTNHLDTMIARIQPEMQRQCTRWSGSYTQWQQNVQYLRNQITGRCAFIGGAMDTCYHVTGPYPLVVNTFPANSGTVTVNTITPTVYPWYSTYFGGVDLVFKANANVGYQFSHWTIQNHTITPGIANDSIWFNLLNTGDSLTAVFIRTDSVHLTVLTNPVAAGNISVNGIMPSSYPYTFTFADSTVLTITETANTGFIFNNWTILHHVLLPNNNAQNVGFMILDNDTLTANYTVIPDSANLTVMANIPAAGTVTVNSSVVSVYPTVLRYQGGTLLNISVTPNIGYNFVNWTLNHHVINPNNTAINGTFTINQDDTLTAVFAAIPDSVDLTVLENISGAGFVAVNSAFISAYPTVLRFESGILLNISATPNIGYNFVNWTLNHHVVSPNNNAITGTFTITQDDTLTANYSVIPDSADLTVMANIPAGGSVTVNGNVVTTYPTTNRYASATLLNLSATPNVGYNFVNWSLNHHVVNPNNNAISGSFTISQIDTLTANFALVPDSANLVVVANIPAGGSVNLNANIISTYPTLIHQATGLLMNITALPNTGYSFVNWSIAHHTINPNTNASTASFTFTQSDTLFVNFQANVANHNVVVQALPANGGDVTVNGTLYAHPNYPYALSVADGSVLNVGATASNGFQFTGWHVVYAAALPSATANPMSCTITQSDTIYAQFAQIPVPDSFNITVQAVPATGGDVSVNGVSYPSPGYPYTLRVETGTQLTVNETPNPTYHFINWQLLHHSPIPNATALPMSFTVVQDDTIYAYYTQDSIAIWVDVWAGGQHNPFAGNVKVAGVTPVSYPAIFKFTDGTNIDFEATGKTLTTLNHTYNYVFDHYDFIYHTPSPDSLTSVVFITAQKSDTVFVWFKDEVINNDTALHVIFPSGFSPDNNGVNDEFRAITNETLDPFNMKIYNRWGQLVFESHNVSRGWNGEFENKKCDIGIYAYTVVAKRLNGEEILKKGTITLVR